MLKVGCFGQRETRACCRAMEKCWRWAMTLPGYPASAERA